MGSALGMVTSTEWRGVLHIYDANRVWAGRWGRRRHGVERRERDRERAQLSLLLCRMSLSVNDLSAAARRRRSDHYSLLHYQISHHNVVTCLLPLMLSSASDLMYLMSAGMVANWARIRHFKTIFSFLEFEHASV